MQGHLIIIYSQKRFCKGSKHREMKCLKLNQTNRSSANKNVKGEMPWKKEIANQKVPNKEEN